MRIELIATAPITYAGKRLKADDRFEASERDSKLLQLVGKAKIPEKTSAPKRAATKPKKSKGRYSRRDMRADA